MNARKILALVAISTAVLTTGSASAALVFYSDRTTFNAAAPGLPVEDFENTLVPSGGLALCTDPVNSASSDACFAPGGVLPGISFQSTSGLIVLGAGFAGNASAVLGPNVFADDLQILLTSGGDAIGMDILSGNGSGTLRINVFGTGGAIGTTDLVLVQGQPQFLGVVATEQIASIQTDDLGGSIGELVDNVAFGTAAVPEPGTLALLGLGLAGLAATRRRKQ